MECVPNFSEGRDLQKIDKIVAPFRGKQGVKLLDYSNDEDHNRLVVTVVGEPEPLRDAVLEAIGVAVELIDLNHHQGQHPRMGAVDVVPFIPIRNVTMEEAVALSKEVGKEVTKRYNLPVFLYEKSASAPHRENLAAVRKGEFEGMAEKIKQPEWHPDFGLAERHPTAGTVAIGARMPLVAYNINLNTPSLEIAHDIAKKIRFIGGAAVRAAVVRGAGLFAAGGFSKSRPVDHRRGVWRRFSRVCAVPWKKAEKAGQTASACGGKAAQAGGNIICRIVKITKSFT